MRFVFLMLVSICCFASCIDTTKIAPKVSDLLVYDDLNRLEFGRDLYIKKCTKCHNALRITRFSKEEWDEILPDMFEKSKMNTLQIEAVTAYIKTVLESSSSLTIETSKGQ
jgi:hypothetical protein